MRLLLVEDEEDLASAIARGLRKEGHAVDVAGDVPDAEIRIVSTEYDLVLLDWNLPSGAGIELCASITDGSLETFGERPRVLMLTARDEVADRVLGLDAGADDYLVKPFAFPELAARIRALLRRGGEATPVFQVGAIRVDPARFEASEGGSPLDLTVKEFSLLHYFVTRPGEVMSQEHLLEHVWDEMADPMTNVVRVTISNLRKKLTDSGVIETVSGRGYRIKA